MTWWIKVAGKVELSRLPIRYETFRKAGLFRHGAMHQADYAVGVVLGHVEHLGGVEAVRGAVCLEIGPGDSLASAVIANALGARRIYLVDAGDFANRDINVYRQVAKRLLERGIPAADLADTGSVDEMLRRLNAEYLTNGLQSLHDLASGSVDLIWSHAVLEHIRLREVGPFFRALRRVSTSHARMSHRIDFMDHLGGSLNNLRFPEWLWESEFMARSGFYTNRVRSSDMQQALRDAGFRLTSVSAGRWDDLPLSRRRLARPFRDLDEEDLLTRYIDVTAEPAEKDGLQT